MLFFVLRGCVRACFVPHLISVFIASLFVEIIWFIIDCVVHGVVGRL